MKTVQEQFDGVYKKYGKPDSAWDRNVIECQCYRDAVKRLEPEEQEEIRILRDRLISNTRQLHHFGETSALELLAKLGMFYNGIKAS